MYLVLWNVYSEIKHMLSYLILSYNVPTTKRTSCKVPATKMTSYTVPTTKRTSYNVPTIKMTPQ